MLQRCFSLLQSDELIELEETRQLIGEFILKFDNIEGRDLNPKSN